jgi:hypothetical protein
VGKIGDIAENWHTCSKYPTNEILKVPRISRGWKVPNLHISKMAATDFGEIGVLLLFNLKNVRKPNKDQLKWS